MEVLRVRNEFTEAEGAEFGRYATEHGNIPALT